MILNVHAGHNPDGKAACGAVGLIKESTEARKVKDKVISYLREQGHTVYDCTCEDGKNQNDVLKKIVAKCNAHTVDLDVSIHFNSGAGDKSGNGKTTGVEVLVYDNQTKTVASDICSDIAALGFKNRGLKTRRDLYVLKNTKAPAILIECCFVDDADDVALYDADKMARAIVKGITGQAVGAAAGTSSAGSSNTTATSSTVYNGIDYAPVYDYDYYLSQYTDLKAKYAADPAGAFLHFCLYGMKAGRIASADFNVKVYRENYPDLDKAFGDELTAYYRHFITHGKAEGRNAVTPLDTDTGTVYDGLDYAPVYDFGYYLKKYADLEEAFAGKPGLAFRHFINHGMQEGRRASVAFEVSLYRANYADLAKAFGDNLPAYYRHYITHGKKEGRVANKQLEP